MEDQLTLDAISEPLCKQIYVQPSATLHTLVTLSITSKDANSIKLWNHGHVINHSYMALFGPFSSHDEDLSLTCHYQAYTIPDPSPL